MTASTEGTLRACTVAVGLLVAGLASGEAQQPIRVGASLSTTGPYAPFGQNQLRGYQLCIKHANEKGGVLGRRLDLLAEDDQSQPATAVRNYETLITQDRVDAVLGPYSSPVLDAVADVAETYRMPLVAASGATSSIFRKGRRFVFMVQRPAETWFEGLIDMAAKRGLRTVAVINEDTLFPWAVRRGIVEVTKRRGLEAIFTAAYPKGTTDFTLLLKKVGVVNPDVLVAPAIPFSDVVAITRQLKELDANPRMFAGTQGVNLPKFYEVLGPSAEFVYGTSDWEPELVTLRAGGLIPIARQYPGAREFVEAYRREFPGADLSYHSAFGYGGCQILLEAIRRAGLLDSERIRETILGLDTNTVYGRFKVDEDGFQVAHKGLIFQWQDGRKVIIWPEELAPGKPRVPTPPWSERP